MPYTLERLAPGSYDVLLDGKVVASLVRQREGQNTAKRWYADLLFADAEPPSPFTQREHAFNTFVDACEWLGVSTATLQAPTAADWIA